MEWTALLSPLISAIVAVFGAYQATKRAAEERQHELERTMNENQITTSTSLAELQIEMRLLSDRVEKHNNVMERTFKLETEVDNLYHRYDEMRNDLKGIGIGGTE